MVKPHPCIFVVELNAYITIIYNNNNIYLSHKNFNKLSGPVHAPNHAYKETLSKKKKRLDQLILFLG